MTVAEAIEILRAMPQEAVLLLPNDPELIGEGEYTLVTKIHRLPRVYNLGRKPLTAVLMDSVGSQ